MWKFSAHKPPNLEIFSLQAPKFGNFQSQAPFSETSISSQVPHFENPGRTPLPEKKKLSAPPPGVEYKVLWLFSMLFIFYCSQLKLFVSKILKHHVFSLPVQFLQQVKIHVFGNDIYLIEPWGGGRQGDTSPSRFEGWGHNIKCPPTFLELVCVSPPSPVSL